MIILIVFSTWAIFFSLNNDTAAENDLLDTAAWEELLSYNQRERYKSIICS